MTLPDCRRCGEEQRHDPGVVCTGCTRRLEVALRGVPSLLELLDDTTAHLDRVERPGGRVEADPDTSLPLTAAVTRLPFDTPASEAAKHLRVLVALWADSLAARHPLSTPPPVDERAAAWLADRTHLLRHHPAAAEACEEVGQACGGAWALVDRPPDTWWAGFCDVELEDEEHPGTLVHCGYELRAPLGAATITCPGCGVKHDAAARREQLLDAAAHHLVTATQAARALTSVDYAVTASNIRKWKFRKRLEQAGVNKAGQPLYRLGDVRDLANRARYGQTITERAS